MQFTQCMSYCTGEQYITHSPTTTDFIQSITMVSTSQMFLCEMQSFSCQEDWEMIPWNSCSISQPFLHFITYTWVSALGKWSSGNQTNLTGGYILGVHIQWCTGATLSQSPMGEDCNSWSLILNSGRSTSVCTQPKYQINSTHYILYN